MRGRFAVPMTNPSGTARIAAAAVVAGCLLAACSTTVTDLAVSTETSAAARGGCPIADDDVGAGNINGDAPSGQGISLEVDRGHSVVCLANRGGSSWSITPEGLAMPVAVVEATGIDSLLALPPAGSTPRSARYVWGVADVAVAAVRVNVGGKVVDARFYDLVKDLKPFLVQVPATGDASVTAVGVGGAVLGAVWPQRPLP